MAQTERNSAFELLRIVAMAMILVVHLDGASLGLPAYNAHWSIGQWWQTIIEAVAIIGVNVFVLISGYFGIRLSWRRLVAYVGMCAFYGLGIFAFECINNPASLTWARAWSQLHVFSGSDLWFIRDYLYLMLLAPLLNGGLDALTRSQRRWLVVSLIVINCYFGWLEDGIVNPTGYCLMQMIFMYVIGYAMRGINLRAWVYASIWAVAVGAIILSACLLPSAEAYAYNSPVVVLAAVTFFGLFTRVRFTSRMVNYVASSTFAVYLIHKNPYLWVGYVRPTVVSLSKVSSGIAFFGMCALFGMIIFTGSILIDKLRAAFVALIGSFKRRN